MASKIRIFIADDHEVVRHGLALALNLVEDFEVVGEAGDGATAVQLCLLQKPDIALLDWKMPQMDGLAATRAIKAQNEAIRTLLLSGAPIEAAVLDALSAEVDGFVDKSISPSQLTHAIRQVAAGQRFLGPEVAQALIERSQQEQAKDETPTLSPREREVLQLMATAATYQEMAEQLFLGEETVRTYVKRVFAKLNQPNRTQAVIAGLRLGLISLDR